MGKAIFRKIYSTSSDRYFLASDDWELTDEEKKSYEGPISDQSLYHDRVYIDNCGRSMQVDGIQIIKVFYFNDSTGPFRLTTYLPEETVASYLNQIDKNGVDGFLANYTKHLLRFRDDAFRVMELYSPKEIAQSKIKEELAEISCAAFAFGANLKSNHVNHE